MRADRSTCRRAGTGLALVLLCLLAALAAGAPSYALGRSGQVGLDPDPADSTAPYDTPSAEPSPTPTDVVVPTTPADSPTPPPPPPTTPGTVSRVGVTVSATNATLTAGYWSGSNSVSIVVTAVNTGNVTEQVALRNAPPAGVAVAPGGCGPGCTFTLAPAASHSVTLNFTVSPNAWRAAPISGTLAFTASAEGADPASGSTSWGVVFPPGPPTPGINLRVANVTLNSKSTSFGHLTVSLTNTGRRPANGVMTVVVPSGVTFGDLPADCQTHRPLKSSTIECGIGAVASGAVHTVSFPLVVSARARAEAPLAGLVRAALTPDGQPAVMTQSSYQITTNAGQNGVTAGMSTPPSPVAAAAPTRGADDLFNRAANFALTGPPAIVWPIIGTSLAALFSAIAGIVYTLQRRRQDDDFAAVPAGPMEPVTDRDDRTAVISAGPLDRTPTPPGPIEWEWTSDTGEREQAAEPAESTPVSSADDGSAAEPQPGPDERVPST